MIRGRCGPATISLRPPTPVADTWAGLFRRCRSSTSILVFTDAAAQQQLLRSRWYSGGYVLRAAEERRLSQLPLPLRQHLDSAALRLTLVPKLTASLADEQAPQMRLEVLELGVA